MTEFFKRIGIGIVVIVTSPFWAAFFVLFILIGTIGLVLSPLRFLISLFTHNKLTIKSEYDEQAKKIIDGSHLGQPSPAFPVNQAQMNNPYPNQNYQQNTYPSPFNDPSFRNQNNSQQNPNNGYPNYPQQNPNNYPPQNNNGYPNNGYGNNNNGQGGNY